MSAPGPAREVSGGVPTDSSRPLFVVALDPDRPPEDIPPFEVLHDGDRVVLLGAVDSFTADRLAALLHARTCGPASVLDLSGLQFLDVAGCRVLARWAQTVCAPPSRLQVTGAPALVRRMWGLLGLDEVAPVAFTAARS